MKLAMIPPKSLDKMEKLVLLASKLCLQMVYLVNPMIVTLKLKPYQKTALVPHVLLTFTQMTQTKIAFMTIAQIKRTF